MPHSPFFRGDIPGTSSAPLACLPAPLRGIHAARLTIARNARAVRFFRFSTLSLPCHASNARLYLLHGPNGPGGKIPFATPTNGKTTMQNQANTPAKSDRAAKLAAAKARNSAKQAGKASAPATDAPAPAAVTAAARGLTRDANTVSAMRTAFGEISDRDAAYRLFFGIVAREAGKPDTFTLAQLRTRSVNPHYAGSNKASDAGAINRAVKAGYFTVSGEKPDLIFTATDKAKSDKFFNGKA